jgi:hypothetical protein
MIKVAAICCYLFTVEQDSNPVSGDTIIVSLLKTRHSPFFPLSPFYDCHSCVGACAKTAKPSVIPAEAGIQPWKIPLGMKLLTYCNLYIYLPFLQNLSMGWIPSSSRMTGKNEGCQLKTS